MPNSCFFVFWQHIHSHYQFFSHIKNTVQLNTDSFNCSFPASHYTLIFIFNASINKKNFSYLAESNRLTFFIFIIFIHFSFCSSFDIPFPLVAPCCDNYGFEAKDIKSKLKRLILEHIMSASRVHKNKSCSVLMGRPAWEQKEQQFEKVTMFQH